jgi:predicted flap endonuclease-1-like 5' DNA nuclease
MTDGMDASNEPMDDARQDEAPQNEEPEELIAAEELADILQDDEVEESFDSPAGGSIPRDDLKKIKGVGPAIEKTLNEMGIYQFNQIAEMSEYEIDRVAHRLKGFRSRIYREDWIGQARDLCDQKVSGQL